MERAESTIKVKKTTLLLFNKMKGDFFKNQDSFLLWLLSLKQTELNLKELKNNNYNKSACIIDEQLLIK